MVKVLYNSEFDLATLGSRAASFLIRKKFFFKNNKTFKHSTDNNTYKLIIHTLVFPFTYMIIANGLGNVVKKKNIYYANILCPHDRHPKWGYAWIFVIQNNVSQNIKSSSRPQTVS